MWASQIRVIEMGTGGMQANTLFTLPLEQNEAAVSLCLIQWPSYQGQHLVVGVAKDVILSPRSCTEGSLHVYKVNWQPSSLQRDKTLKGTDICAAK